jgi:arsenite-transporting ATPase
VRILLFSGKGGAGKTSLAAATGLQLARLGKRTLVMSIDPAHSLADAFDLDGALFHDRTAEPLAMGHRLAIQEVNIQREIRVHWSEISAYVTGLLRTTGLGDVEASELAILPGMEELSAMMYVNLYCRDRSYDVIVLDCAPTAESMRFVAMPTTLEWYMKHIFPFQRTILKAVRPVANRVAPFELPPDRYFDNVQQLFAKLDGIDALLGDPKVTSVRLVTNPEKMVIRETQRAFTYFSVHGLVVDQVIVNRVLPPEVHDSYFADWRRSQQRALEEIEEYFAPVAVRRVPLFRDEVLGKKRLQVLASALYGKDEDPSEVTEVERPFVFVNKDGKREVRLRMPFAEKSEINLFKKGDELVVQVGAIRRHVGLPTSMASLVPARARLEDGTLVVEMKEAQS